MFIVPFGFLLVMLGGMGLTAFDAYEGIGIGLVVVGLCGTTGTAGLATQS